VLLARALGARLPVRPRAGLPEVVPVVGRVLLLLLLRAVLGRRAEAAQVFVGVVHQSHSRLGLFVMWECGLACR